MSRSSNRSGWSASSGAAGCRSRSVSCRRRGLPVNEPGMVRIEREVPGAIGSSHHIEVVAVIAGRNADWVETGWDENDVTIHRRQRFVQGPVPRVDALEGEALRLCEPVEVDLLETRLGRGILSVVLVRWVARPIAAWREHLERDQPTGLRGWR